MNRSHKTVISSWGLLLSVTLTSLFTIRIGLSYISEAELGLWIVIRQTVGYLIMFDMGVGISIARLYGKAASKGPNEAQDVMTNSFAVLLLQTALIIVIGFALGQKIGAWFNIDVALQATAVVMLYAVCFTGSIRQLCRVDEAYLFSVNKLYLVHGVTAIAAWIELIVLWIFLHNGYGLKSFIASQISLATITAGGIIIFAKKNSFKKRFNWKNVRTRKIKKILGYSMNMFVINIFGQLLFVGQPLIVGVLHGLEATAQYSINSRAGTFLRMILARTVESFLPYWQIQFDKGNITSLSEDWAEKLRQVFALSLVSSIFFVAGNEIFTGLISSPQLYMSSLFDSFTALFIIIHVFIGVLTYPFLVAMRIRLRAFISCLQIMVALPLAAWMGLLHGPQGVLIGLSIGIVMVGGIYNIIFSPKQFNKTACWLFVKVIYPNSMLLILSAIVLIIHANTSPSVMKIMLEVLVGLVASSALIYYDKDLRVKMQNLFSRN